MFDFFDNIQKEDLKLLTEIQKRIQSFGYRTGRLSPTREVGTHLFQELISNTSLQRHKLMKQVVLVTGGSSGIGKATAALFAQRGYQVAISARRLEELHKVQRELGEGGAEVVAIPCFRCRSTWWSQPCCLL